MRKQGGILLCLIAWLLVGSSCHLNVKENRRAEMQTMLEDWEVRLVTEQDALEAAAEKFTTLSMGELDSLGKPIPRDLDSMQTVRLQTIRQTFADDLEQGLSAWSEARMEVDAASSFYRGMIADGRSTQEATRKWQELETGVEAEMQQIATAKQQMEARQWALRMWQDSLQLPLK